jgi:hypothetical protein
MTGAECRVSATINAVKLMTAALDLPLQTTCDSLGAMSNRDLSNVLVSTTDAVKIVMYCTPRGWELQYSICSELVA